MIPDRSRRDVIIGIAAITAGSAITARSDVSAAQSQNRFMPPGEPMRLSRTLVREIGDSARIVVTRDWGVRFVPGARGYMLEGRQRSASVEAPSILEPLAELERQRDGGGIFPILLDAAGVVRDAGKPGSDHHALFGQAIARTRAMLATKDRNPNPEHLTFLSALRHQALGPGSRWPDDLFFPARLSDLTTQDLAAPNGVVGSVTMAFTAELGLAGTHMTRAKRTITTRIAGTARRSIESWTLRRF